MEIAATAKNIRVSPQKVRLVVDQIKQMKPQMAITMLDYVNKRAALPIKKVVASALANAKHNFNVDENSLVFKSLQVTEGRRFKRWRPISRGRAHSILKRTSHIKVVLEVKEDKTNSPNKSNMSNKKKLKGGQNGSKS